MIMTINRPTSPGISEFPDVPELEEIDGPDGEDHYNSATDYDSESKYWGWRKTLYNAWPLIKNSIWGQSSNTKLETEMERDENTKFPT